MSTKIEWTEETWNPVVGCTKVSPGCTHCYAETVAASGRMQRLPQYKGTIEKGHWTGKVNLVPHKLGDPLKWKHPKRIFVNSMSDLFHEDVPDEYIAAVFGVMAACPQHTFQVLTKRPKRMLKWFSWVDTVVKNDSAPWFKSQMCQEMLGRYVSSRWDAVWECAAWPLPNVWLGVSVEDQKRADERVPILMEVPAVVRFLSCEPLLGEVHLRQAFLPPRIDHMPHLGGELLGTIDWVIVGGESGKNARPMNPDWVRSIRDQCVAVGVPFFFKQWGEFEMKGYAGTPQDYKEVMVRVGKKSAGRMLDGVEHNEYPRS